MQMRPLNILYLTSFGHYYTNMDRFLYDEIRAASANKRFNVTVWGKGWANYNDSATVFTNVQERFGCTFFCVIVQSHNIMGGANIAEWPCAATKTARPIVLWNVGDCHYNNASAVMPCVQNTPSYADIVQARYGHVLLSAFYPVPAHLSNRARLFVENVDCALIPSTFVQPISNRTGAVLIGSTWKALYPLRHNARVAIADDLIHNGHILAHPGYTVKGVDTTQSKSHRVFDASAPDLQHHRDKRKVYARALSTRAVCIFGSSNVRKMIRKYAEAALAGCVIAADVPLDMWREWSGAMIRLPHRATPATIAGIINAALAKPTLLQKYQNNARALAKRHLSCDARVERLYASVVAYKNGRTGFHLPYSTAIDCFTANVDGGSNLVNLTLPWC